METIFKEKDRVFDIRYGWGTVEEVDESDDLIGVEFDNVNPSTFRKIKYFNKIGLGTISFTEYTLEGFSQKRPEILPERGQIVWVRNFGEAEWIIAKFIVKSAGGRYICTHGNAYLNAGIEWKFMTTIDPHQNEK
jgi:hypothetical protein